MIPMEVQIDVGARFREYEIPDEAIPLSVGFLNEHRKYGEPVLRFMAPFVAMRSLRTVACIDANDDSPFEGYFRFRFVGTIEHPQGVFHVFMEKKR